MQYALEVLKKELELLSKCLSEWETTEYPEAKKEREKRLTDIKLAINTLESKI